MITQTRYSQHKANATRRGIEFNLTFEEWSKIWVDSGHQHQRGPKKDQYVMARYGDVGAYAVGNVKIITWEANRSEQRFGRETRARMSIARMGNRNSVGRKDSLETRTKKSIALMGNSNASGKHSAEECERQSERSRKMWADPEFRERQIQIRSVGRPHTQESRERMSQSHLGKVMSPEARANMRIAAAARGAKRKKKNRRLRILSIIRRDLDRPVMRSTAW